LQQAINKFCLTDFKKDLQIVVSPMGEKAKIFGTKSLVFDKLITELKY